MKKVMFFCGWLIGIGLFPALSAAQQETATVQEASGGVPLFWILLAAGILLLVVAIPIAIRRALPPEPKLRKRSRPSKSTVPAQPGVPLASLNTLTLTGSTERGAFDVQANFPADAPPLQIGSSDDPRKGNDLVLPFPTISRVHARIERADDRLLITDLDSVHGVGAHGDHTGRGGTVSVANGDTVMMADIAVTIVLTHVEPDQQPERP